MSLTRTCESKMPTGEMERNVTRHRHTDLAEDREITYKAGFCERCSKSVCHGCYCGHHVPGVVENKG